MNENEDKVLTGMKLLEELREKAKKIQGCEVHVTVATEGWYVMCWRRTFGADSRGVTAVVALDDLRKLATPPKPKTVMIEMPYELVENIADAWHNAGSNRLCQISEICREAIKPYEEPQA